LVCIYCTFIKLTPPLHYLLIFYHQLTVLYIILYSYI
jgi:hypothetical protein